MSNSHTVSTGITDPVTRPSQRPTARQIVRDDAAQHGWELLTFADKDSFKRQGHIVNITWVNEGRGSIGASFKLSSGDWHTDHSAMCIVHARGWLKEYGLEATVDHHVGS